MREREVGIIKARTRVLLRSSKSPIHFWHLASRHALEERFREQLAKMGISTPPILPFGAVAVARKKSWFNRSEPWKWPMERVKCYGPAADMGLASRGHHVQLEDGKFIRSTIIAVPRQKAETLEEVRQLRQQGEGLERGEGVTFQAQGSVEDATLDVEGDHRDQEERGFNPGELEILIEEVAQLEKDFPQSSSREVEMLESATEATMSRKPRLKKNPLLDHERQAALSLCQLQGKGEWSEGEGEDQENNRIALQLWQHQEFTRILQEEASNWLEGTLECEGVAATLRAVKQEVKGLEEQLVQANVGERECRVKSLQAQIEQEVLRTRVVELDEVRRDLEGWREAFVKEHQNLTAGPVVPMSAEEYAELVATGAEIEMLPMKSVTTLKPPNRRKARLVVCGNVSNKEPELDVSVGGACTMTIRTVVHLAVNRGWSMGSIDVTGAFLQAPRRCKSRVTVADPPGIMRTLGLVQYGEKWRIQSAL